ncbi:hypothetical protein ACVWY3_008057 [Bradyrhizobium sp. USDA 4486]
MSRGAASRAGALPLPLAGESWGEGVSSREAPQEEKALTRIASSMRSDLSRNWERCTPLAARSNLS